MNGKFLKVIKYYLPKGLSCFDGVMVIINDIKSGQETLDLAKSIKLILRDGKIVLDDQYIDFKDAQAVLSCYNRLLEVNCDNCKHDDSISRSSTISNFYFCKLEDEEYVKKCSLDDMVFFTDKVRDCRKDKKCEDFKNRELPEGALPISEIVQQLS